MSSLCVLAASLVAHGQAAGWELAVLPAGVPSNLPSTLDISISQLCQRSTKTAGAVKASMTVATVDRPEFSPMAAPVSPAATLPVADSTAPVVAPLPVETSNPIETTTSPEADPSVDYNTAATDAIHFSGSQMVTSRPMTGAQLYQQRLLALRTGHTYTNLATDSFRAQWLNATAQPSYRQWVALLQREAKAMETGQGKARLSVIVGDSIAMWLPPEIMSRDRFWLNQGISGDTTKGTLQRLSALDNLNPDMIHVMTGINDLRRGATDAEVVNNLRQIMQKLRSTHPNARIIVHSILPTRLAALPTDRIRRLNYRIALAAEEEGVFFLNLYPAFSDDSGILRRELTTDGIHLSAIGYQAWESVISTIL